MSDTKNEDNVEVFESDNTSTTPPQSGATGSVSFLKKIDRFFSLQDSDESKRNSNKDMDPLPVERRTWKGWQLACYWGSDMLNASAMRTVVSLRANGINSKNALLASTLGNLIIGVILALHGRFGVKYHVPFAVQARASFGYYLAYLMMLFRLVAGGIWYGTNVYTGAECIQSIIYAMLPGFRNVKNHLPASANITTQTMISYLIYFIISLPFHYIRQEKIQWIFTLKTLLVPVLLFGILGWSLAVSDHPGSYWDDANTVSGSLFSWAMVSSISSSAQSFLTLAVNINDFIRYTDDPKLRYIQILVLPSFSIFTSCVGLVMAGASEYMWGEALWDPLEIIDHWTSPGGRAAAFFVALILLFGQILVNLSANCASALNDLNALIPRYINIRRGQFLILFIFAWGATPWNILAGTSSLLNFMNGYAIFLGPMAGIMVADIYLVHNNKYHITEFYKSDGAYRYNKFGMNWRACLAFLVAIGPQLPAFAASVTPSITVSDGCVKMGQVGYFYNFLSAFIVYAVCSMVFPAKETYFDEAVTLDDLDFRAVMSRESVTYPEGKDA